MAEDKKPAAKSKKIADVAKPGATAPPPNSKSVIITHRPAVQDPMVTADKPAETGASEDTAVPISVSRSPHTVLQPLATSPKAAELTNPEVAAPAEAKTEEPAPIVIPEPKTTTDKPSKAEAEDSEAETPKEITTEAKVGTKEVQSEADVAAEEDAEAERLEKLQELVDSKKYYLPIKTVENRRAMQLMGIGVFVAALLGVAWVDIALDAGIIQLGNIKPVTHFFSTIEPAAPVVANASQAADKTIYHEPGSKLQFTYPKTWKVQPNSASTTDLTVSPVTATTPGGTINLYRTTTVGAATTDTLQTISYANYEPVTINGKAFTLRQLVFYNAASKFQYQTVRVDLTNTAERLVAGQTTKLLDAPITLPDGSTASFFVYSIAQDGQSYKTLADAKKFFDSSDYKAIKPILVSLKY